MKLWLQFGDTPKAEELKILGHIAIAFFNYNQEFTNIRCLKMEVIQNFRIPNGPTKVGFTTYQMLVHDCWFVSY